MPSEVFAFVGFDTDQIVQYAMKSLAVAGGFLVGWVLIGLIAWLLDRWLTGGKSPHLVHRVARILGGALIAVIIALLLFGRGGYGDGNGPGGGGPIDQKGEGTGGTQNQTQPTSLEVKPIQTPQPKDNGPRELIRVTVLAGEDVKQDKYYLIEEDRAPQNLKGLSEVVTKRKESSKKLVKILVQYAPGAGYDTIGAAQLRRWSESNGIDLGRDGN